MSHQLSSVSNLRYTCLTCHVAFVELAWQKEHFTSDWHRYNCKRKVADLPPLSIEEFARRLQEQSAEVNE